MDSRKTQAGDRRWQALELSIPFHGFCNWLGGSTWSPAGYFQFHFMDSASILGLRSKRNGTIMIFQFHFMDSRDIDLMFKIGEIVVVFQFHFMDSELPGTNLLLVAADDTLSIPFHGFASQPPSRSGALGALSIPFHGFSSVGTRNQTL